MAKKKREHIVFDQMSRIRKRVDVNKYNTKGNNNYYMKKYKGFEKGEANIDNRS